jgi:hypothetical protein
LVPQRGSEDTVSAKAAGHQLSLVKGRERYLVRFAAGCEEEAITQLMRWAEDADLDFDWFDAAVLSRQIDQKLMRAVLGDLADAPDDES